MRLLLLLAALVQPQKSKCIISCEAFEQNSIRVTKCWFEELPTCKTYQPLCVESRLVVCENWAKSLGPWNFVPEDQKTYFYSAPTPEPERKRFDYTPY